MTRKFFINSNSSSSILGGFTVYEQVRGGCRSVAPIFINRKDAEVAMDFLRANPEVARVVA